MAKPWERYQTTADAEGATREPLKPWESYGARGRVRGASAVQKMVDPNAPTVIQEMHPQFSSLDRFVAKTGSKDPEAAMAYYQQENPDMEFRRYAGQTLMRAPGEEAWHVADPEGITSPMEFVRDAGDVAYDLGAGAVTGLAGMLGGVAGLATGPGALLTGAASAGATGAGLEALRQKLGQYMGIPQEVDYGDVATAGALSAFFPGLGGTGVKATTKGIVGQKLKQKMAEKGITAEAAEEAQKGIISKLAPKLGEGLSGVPQQALAAQKTYGPQLKDATDQTVTELAEKTYKNVKEGFAVKKQQIGERLSKEIDEAGEMVDISGAKQQIQNRIATLKKQTQNQETLDKIAELETQYKRIFHEKKEVTKLVPDEGGLLDEFGSPLSTKQVKEEMFEELPNQVSAKRAFELKQDLDGVAETWRFQKDSGASRFSPAQTPGERLKLEAARKGAKDIHKQLAEATKGKSDELKNMYADYSQMQRDVTRKFSSPERTHRTLSNLYGQNKSIVRTQIDRAQKATGVNIQKAADKLSAIKFFKDPKMLPLSGGGTTSTSRTGVAGVLGGAVGAKIGMATGLGPWAGATLGAGAANVASSPWAMKRYIDVARGAQKGASLLSEGKYSPFSLMPTWSKRGAPISAWQSLQER